MFKCRNCDCSVHGMYINILGEMWCVDCAEEFMEEELEEMKLKNRSYYLEKLAEITDFKIWEV